MKKIKIRLTPEEVIFLKKYKQGKGRSLRETNRANILLLCNKGKSEKEIAEFFDAGPNTVWRIKKRYLEGGLGHALAENPRPGQPVKYNQTHKTELTAIACTEPPEGHERWTLELLTEKMRSSISDCKNISKETIRLCLKKTGISPGSKKCGA